MSKHYQSTEGFHPRTAPLTTVPVVEPGEYGRDWSPIDVDIFLDLYLGGSGKRSKKAIAEILGRNEKAITMIEWKVPTAYPPHRYTAGKREDRTGKAWHTRDLAVLSLGRNAEARKRGVDTAYIAAVLGRSVADVGAHEAKVKQAKGGGFGL